MLRSHVAKLFVQVACFPHTPRPFHFRYVSRSSTDTNSSNSARSRVPTDINASSRMNTPGPMLESAQDFVASLIPYGPPCGSHLANSKWFVLSGLLPVFQFSIP